MKLGEKREERRGWKTTIDKPPLKAISCLIMEHKVPKIVKQGEMLMMEKTLGVISRILISYPPPFR
jgi:hypothetical protein